MDKNVKEVALGVFIAELSIWAFKAAAAGISAGIAAFKVKRAMKKEEAAAKNEE